ncbi:MULTISPECIES: hypothetical protein [Microbispora]|uniref:Uncharacterized protein n=1 Tax=Microbispora siamensis TaxID=564413 RepID=A0ABQ4GVM8_9ACTN|nr:MULTISPECIES: hypothetical protein [Microbispora]OPG05871.1 hypothetical protein B1L11_34260 [Microbispora sp. GKU 823]GIH65481.1 hypothetical protein Msi02_62980 [Microbispora siamensis]
MPPREHTRTYFLGKLARELELRGLEASLRPDPPSLKVRDPDAALFTETVDCVAMSDGWFYRWSWGDVVESAEEPALAADRIVKVFTTGEPRPHPALGDA